VRKTESAGKAERERKREGERERVFVCARKIDRESWDERGQLQSDFVAYRTFNRDFGILGKESEHPLPGTNVIKPLTSAI
jgi:hypothetical protein